MKDYLKQELAVGDQVVYVTPGYREFRTGTIERFTKLNVIIVTGETSWRGTETLKQGPGQLIKIPSKPIEQ